MSSSSTTFFANSTGDFNSSVRSTSSHIALFHFITPTYHYNLWFVSQKIMTDSELRNRPFGLFQDRHQQERRTERSHYSSRSQLPEAISYAITHTQTTRTGKKVGRTQAECDSLRCSSASLFLPHHSWKRTIC